MPPSNDDCLPSFRTIREAILAAPPPPPGFPLEALRDPDRLQALRRAAHLGRFMAGMRAEAERARSTPIPPLPFDLFHLFETTGDRTAYETPYFDRRRRLAGLALTAVLDETDNYLPALADLIWEICNEYTWSLPAHLPVGVDAVQAHHVPPEQVVDLFAAHTAHALAEVPSLLGDRLDPWLVYRIRGEVERRIFEPLFTDPHHFEWESLPMNWSAVCGGCAGMAALILVDNRERLAGMLDRVIRSLDCFLEGFGSDGGCPEGIDYWVYGFGFYTYFAEMLRSFTAGQIDLLRGKRIERIAAFPQVVSLGDGAYVNYSDASEHTTIHPGIGSHLATCFDRPVPGLRMPDFHDDPIYRWGNVTRDLLWTEAASLDAPVGEGSFYLADLAWVVERRVVDGVTIAFSAKGGNNDEPHNHNDLGHFILHLGGESLLADLGAGVYTRQYFGPERYAALHTGSQGHSVPTINRQAQRAGSIYAARALKYSQRPDGVEFSLDLTHAYADTGLASFTRSFDWSVDADTPSAVLRLTDSFRFTAFPAAVEECFVSLLLPLIGESVVSWTGKSGMIGMRFDREQFEASVDAIETETHQGEPVIVYRLRLRALEETIIRNDTFVFDCLPGDYP
jgi:hypothetical protein